MKEGLGRLLCLPFVLINGGSSARTRGVREIKYPAHTGRGRASVGEEEGEIGKALRYLGNSAAAEFCPIYIPRESDSFFPPRGGLVRAKIAAPGGSTGYYQVLTSPTGM